MQELYDLQRFSIKMGLENIRALSDFLGDPQERFPAIHLAGTNGKGSTAIMIQGILQHHGMRTGLYTSPHLVVFNERIRIGDRLIGDADLVKLWRRIRALVLERKATFFDATTALAFQYFADQKVDAAVIETGLGGRLDSTNILHPRAVVLTPIDRDHEKQLGRDYAGIAQEKAAIIKSGAIVFSARQRPETRSVFEPLRGRREGFVSVPDQVRLADIRADGTGMRFSMTDTGRREEFSDLRLTLDGAHQAENAALAYLCARWYLEAAGQPFSETQLRKALTSIRWPGRLQKVAENPDIIFDVSHNEAGFATTLEYAAARYPDKNRQLLLGLLADKDVSRIVQMAGGIFNRVIVTEPVSPRKLAAAELQAVFRSRGITVEAVPEIGAAYARATEALTGNDVLFVMGSHFLIGELLKTIGKRT